MRWVEPVCTAFRRDGTAPGREARARPPEAGRGGSRGEGRAGRVNVRTRARTHTRTHTPPESGCPARLRARRGPGWTAVGSRARPCPCIMPATPCLGLAPACSSAADFLGSSARGGGRHHHTPSFLLRQTHLGVSPGPWGWGFGRDLMISGLGWNKVRLTPSSTALSQGHRHGRPMWGTGRAMRAVRGGVGRAEAGASSPLSSHIWGCFCPGLPQHPAFLCCAQARWGAACTLRWGARNDVRAVGCALPASGLGRRRPGALWAACRGEPTGGAGRALSTQPSCF